MTTDSNLLGGESSVYSFTDVNGREVILTPSRIITEKSDSSRGRFITLDKVSMVKKKQPYSASSGFFWSVISAVFTVLALLSALLFFSEGPSSGTQTLLVSTIVFALGAALFYYKGRQVEKEAQAEREDQTFINVRTCEGGVGFTIEDEKVNQFMTELQGQLETEVSVKDNR